MRLEEEAAREQELTGALREQRRWKDFFGSSDLSLEQKASIRSAFYEPPLSRRARVIAAAIGPMAVLGTLIVYAPALLRLLSLAIR